MAGEPSSSYDPSCSSYIDTSPTLVTSSDDESEDENPPLHTQPPPSLAPQLPKWVCSTREVVVDLVSDPTDWHRTRSQYQQASSLLAQVPETYDLETFEEAFGHPDWDAAMNEEYHFLLANNTWDLVPLPKGRKVIRCKWVYKTKYGLDGSIDKYKAHLVAKGFSQNLRRH